MDLELIKKLIDLMVDNDLSRMELREGETHILLRRGQPIAAVQPVLAGPGLAAAPGLVPAHAAGAAAGGPAGASGAATGQPSGLVPAENEVFIRSPMVGTFYASPDPESAPFVSAGTVVNPETVVCLIEAMKVFNELKAECSGRITKVLVKNGQAVEFDQPLFAVMPG